MSQASVSSLPVPGTSGPCWVGACPARVQAMLLPSPIFTSNHTGFRCVGARKALLSNTPQIYFLARRLSEVVRIGGSLLRKALASSGRGTHGACLVRTIPGKVQAMPSSTSVFDSNHAAFRRSGTRKTLLSNTAQNLFPCAPALRRGAYWRQPLEESSYFVRARNLRRLSVKTLPGKGPGNALINLCFRQQSRGFPPLRHSKSIA